MTHDASRITHYSQALAYLARFLDLERGGVPASVLGLDRIRQLLAELGRPHERYPSVLIAGTNGKGSTAAMVERALRAAGYRTGLYTQPHLHTIRERVRIDGESISSEAFGGAMDDVRAAVEGVRERGSPTTAYEVMTALALELFAREKVEIAVLEVGLGGRLDATNVVEAAVSALTSISLDHTQILGDTIEAIAAEKAEIIKPGRPCVSAPQPSEALAVIRRVARARGAELRVAGRDGARWVAGPCGWELSTAHGPIQVRLALGGPFQRINAAVAATILDALWEAGVVRLDLHAVRAGMESVVWPGRFETTAGAPAVVVDGAHNVEAARRLREALDEAYPGAERVFVLGVAADKDIPGMVEELLRKPGVRAVVATRASHPRAADPAEIALLVRAAGLEALTAPTVAAALDSARALASLRDVVVATGSLYVVAEAREALGLAEPSGEATFDPWATSPPRRLPN